VTRNKFLTEDPKIVGDIVPNVVATAPRRLGFVCFSLKLKFNLSVNDI
jgi:hypothetical protein